MQHCTAFTLTFTQIPQPMQSSSEIHASLLLLDTSMHSLPARQQYGSMHAHVSQQLDVLSLPPSEASETCTQV
jgi:hypothetical protein